MVTLAEDLYVLACHADTGRLLIPTTSLDLGLGGALLLDAVLRDRVALVHSHVVVVDPAPVGEPLSDAALRSVGGDAKAHEPEYWVRHLARGARHAVQNRLVAAGVLRMEDHKVLGLIPVHHTHQTDGRLGHELMDHLTDAVVLGRKPDRFTVALVSLALAVGLEPHLFPRSDQRAIRRRMQDIADGEWVGSAVRHEIDAVNAVLGIGP